MSVRDLRARHAHAVHMARIYPGRGWPKVVARLCAEIMKRTRRSKTNSGGEPRGKAHSSLSIRREVAQRQNASHPYERERQAT